MSQDLPNMKVKLVELITKIVDVSANWEIKVTPFSGSILPTTSFYSDHDNTKAISTYIDNLDTISSTALYEAMHEVYSYNLAHTSSNKNNVIFTITDGQDTDSRKTHLNIISLAELLREKAPQSTMYNIGYSHYDKKFFDELSQNTASKTVHLDKISDLEELFQDINTINNCKVLYEFGSHQYAQCAAGDIFIPSFTIDETTQVKVGGEVYSIGVESVI